MNTINETAAVSTSTKTGSNKPTNDLDECREIAREAAKHFGATKLANDKDKLGLRAFYFIVYQDDEYTRGNVDKYLRSLTKIASKLDKEIASKWLHYEYELVAPKKGAMGESVTKYRNTIAALKRALADIVSVYNRGVRMIRQGRQVYVTAESYAKVMDAEATRPIEVTMMASKSTVTFNGLTIAKVPKTGTSGDRGKVVTANAANFKVICQMIEKSATEVEPEKMDGAQRIAGLKAMFSLMIALGRTPSKKDHEEYDNVAKAQSA